MKPEMPLLLTPAHLSGAVICDATITEVNTLDVQYQLNPLRPGTYKARARTLTGASAGMSAPAPMVTTLPIGGLQAQELAHLSSAVIRDATITEVNTLDVQHQLDPQRPGMDKALARKPGFQKVTLTGASARTSDPDPVPASLMTLSIGGPQAQKSAHLSGAVIRDATITEVNTLDVQYQLNPLRPRTYKALARKPGFQTVTLKGASAGTSAPAPMAASLGASMRRLEQPAMRPGMPPFLTTLPTGGLQAQEPAHLSGAVIRDATITEVNTLDGQYQLSPLHPGMYRVLARKPGSQAAAEKSDRLLTRILTRASARTSEPALVASPGAATRRVEEWAALTAQGDRP